MKMMDCLLMSPARTVVERAASTTRGPRLLIMVRREDRCDDVSSVSSPLSNWFSVVRPGQAPTHAQCALQ